MTKFKDGRAGDVAYTFRRFDVGGIVVRIIAEFFHQRFVNGFGVRGKKVGERTIGSVADGFSLVGDGALAGRTAKCTA